MTADLWYAIGVISVFLILKYIFRSAAEDVQHDMENL
jgi:hypothetical protein